jgi:hypothetical protein
MSMLKNVMHFNLLMNGCSLNSFQKKGTEGFKTVLNGHFFMNVQSCYNMYRKPRNNCITVDIHLKYESQYWREWIWLTPQWHMYIIIDGGYSFFQPPRSKPHFVIIIKPEPNSFRMATSINKNRMNNKDAQKMKTTIKLGLFCMHSETVEFL